MPSTARRDRVPNAPFRARFLQLKAQGFSSSDVAKWLGWWRNDRGDPDSSRVERQLGVRPWPGGVNRPRHTAESMSYERAVEMCEALSMDPFECGV